ncbi:FAD-binding protein [Alteromonas gracilis]|uniref:FAD-binding protein n=1 Tax=Alteromonas gracilis TaxID=1479524 RepID=UPI00373534BC
MRTLDLGYEKLRDLLLESGFQSSQISSVDTNDANITYPDSNPALLVVKPSPSQSSGASRYNEVVTLIQLAKDNGFAIHPYSKGANLGYGGKEPYGPNCLALDLSAFDRISNYHKTSGHITVEPGVSQEAISAFLKQNGDVHIHDTTGAPKFASVVGNYLERGFGHTPLAEHAKNILHAEFIVPNSKGQLPTHHVTSTDGTAFEIDEKKVHRTYSIGPDMTGLIIQNNISIVTSLTIKLLKKPECFVAYFIPFKKEDTEQVIDTCAMLRKQNTIHSAAHIGNNMKTLQLLAVQFPELITSYDFDELKKLIDMFSLDDWTLSGGMYGTPHQVKAHIKDLKAAMKKLGVKPLFIDEKKLGFIKKTLSLPPKYNKALVKKLISSDSGALRKIGAKLALRKSLLELCKIKQGTPSNEFLRTIYWRNLHKLTDSVPNPSKDKVGLLWGAPCSEISSKDFNVITSIMDDTCKKYKFESPISVTLINERTMECVLSLSWNREEENEDERALACYKEIMLKCANMGFLQYRMSTFSNQFFDQHHLPMPQSLLNLKLYLDPCNVISPSKYDLVSKNFTTNND